MRQIVLLSQEPPLAVTEASKVEHRREGSGRTAGWGAVFSFPTWLWPLRHLPSNVGTALPSSFHTILTHLNLFFPSRLFLLVC